MSAIVSGYQKIQQEIAKRKAQAGGFVSLWSIYWKGDGDSKIIRHLHDDPTTIGMHRFITCKDGSKKNFVCREYLVEITPEGLELTPEPCPLCLVEIVDDKGNGRMQTPLIMAVGVAALREAKEINGIRTIVDVPREVTKLKDGKQITLNVPTIGIVSQSLTNFWNGFVAYYLKYHTTIDRDYEVVRSGSGGKGQGNKVSYTPMAEDPIEGFRTETEVLDHYKEVLEDKKPIEALGAWILYNGSESYMRKHLQEEVLANVGWKPLTAKPKIDEDKDEPAESLADHPGGMDEFAPRVKAETEHPRDVIEGSGRRGDTKDLKPESTQNYHYQQPEPTVITHPVTPEREKVSSGTDFTSLREKLRNYQK